MASDVGEGKGSAVAVGAGGSVVAGGTVALGTHPTTTAASKIAIPHLYSVDPILLGLDRQIQAQSGEGNRRLHAIPLEQFRSH